MADAHYRSLAPLSYSSKDKLPLLGIVSIPLRQRTVTGFVVSEHQTPPKFKTKPIKSVLSQQPLPYHCLQLAEWIHSYYASTLAEALRQFAPSKPLVKRSSAKAKTIEPQLIKNYRPPALTAEQRSAIKLINDSPSATALLHGDTGTGKTRVYIELAKQSLAKGQSAIILTPEISLTSQLLVSIKQHISHPIYVLHSQLSDAERKKIWFEVLEAKEPIIIIGPRSALFSPLANIGLIAIDEAHESAYKQDKSPYYHANRVASQLGILTGAKVVLGTATPSITDYYLASQKNAVTRMKDPAVGIKTKVDIEVIDLKNRTLFNKNPYISNKLLDAINTTLKDKKQIVIYLNKRGSAHDILCKICGWHFFCPNCDIPLVYHADQHLARCHICGYKKAPPVACPKCNNPEIIFRSIGTKSLTDELLKLFPEANIKRFDSDNIPGERLHESYSELLDGKIDILVGTQLLAKGLDLPKLALVGIINAETSLGLPDFTSEERAFQLLYQIIGRVGRGHSSSTVVVQSYDPGNIVLKSAQDRDWQRFYEHTLIERRQFKFPPFCYLLQLTCKRATIKGAETASLRLKKALLDKKLPVEVIGPTPSFYARRGNRYYYQLVVKSKQRKYLETLAKEVPAEWQVNLDPVDLL